MVALIAGSGDLTLIIEPSIGGLLPQPLLEDMKAKKRRVLHHQQQLVERGLNLGPAGAAASDDEEYMLPPVSRGKRFPPPLHARSDH